MNSTALYSLCLLATLVATGCGPEPAASRRPNVVVIVIDTLRADRLPFYGHEVNTAPFLAELATEGMVYDRAWAASSWTAPATASIFTGLYPNEHGVTLGLRAGQKRTAEVEGYDLNRIPDHLETLPTFMKELGYRTFGASANPNVDARLGFERGFDHFAPFERRHGKSGAALASRVLEWKEELKSGEPFFLYLHFADPHGPFTRHEEWMTSGEPAPKNPLDDIGAYDSEIRFADENIRKIFEALELEDSFTIVTSDHGQEFLDHGQRGHGWQLYSELTRVPLLIHYPALSTLRGRVEANVTTVDILATLRAFLGEGESEGGADRSLLSAAGGEGPGERLSFAMRSQHDGAAANRISSLVEGRYKLILHEPSGRTELYDLASDPREKENIASRSPKIAKRLRAVLVSQQAAARSTDTRSSARVELSPDLMEALEELGYAEGDVNSGDADPAGTSEVPR